MGISNLLKVLQPSAETVNVSIVLRGKTVAIDALCWIHKGLYSAVEALYHGHASDAYVKYCEKQLRYLLKCGVIPIMVFDGQPLPAKSAVNEKRRHLRCSSKSRVEAMLKSGLDVDSKVIRSMMSSALEVTKDMINEVISACHSMGVDVVVAPYEADAQLAYLNINGYADYVLTEDSDILVFGARDVLFKFDSNSGSAVQISQSNLFKSFDQVSKMSFLKFQLLCILFGCDYLANFDGLGPAKAMKIIQKLTPLLSNSTCTQTVVEEFCERLPHYIQSVVPPRRRRSTSDTGIDTVSNPQQYARHVYQAFNTFRYQAVFCPTDLALRRLNELQGGIKEDDINLFAGRILLNENKKPDCVKIAQGGLCFRSRQPITSCPSVWPSRSLWRETNKEDNNNVNQKRSLTPSRGFNAFQCEDDSNHLKKSTPPTPVEAQPLAISPKKHAPKRLKVSNEVANSINNDYFSSPVPRSQMFHLKKQISRYQPLSNVSNASNRTSDKAADNIVPGRRTKDDGVSILGVKRHSVGVVSPYFASSMSPLPTQTISASAVATKRFGLSKTRVETSPSNRLSATK